MARKGDRVELIRTSDPYTRLAPGERGTVRFVDALGTVHVEWDSGARLGLVGGEGLTGDAEVEAAILAMYDAGFDASAEDVTVALIDRDVARGDYGGCSPELEMAYAEYRNRAARLLGEGGDL